MFLRNIIDQNMIDWIFSIPIPLSPFPKHTAIFGKGDPLKGLSHERVENNGSEFN